MPVSNVSDIVPDSRFAFTLLNVDLAEQSLDDELMMDKNSGEIVYSRKKDKKLVRYSQENVLINDFLSQVKSRISITPGFQIPKCSTSKKAEDTLFISSNIALNNFVKDGDGILYNPAPNPFTFSQETNGFFVQLKGRPRDQALIGFLNSIYNKTYENYDGTDKASLDQKALFANPGYAESHFVINYTVTWYGEDDTEVASETEDGYVVNNSVTLVPFKNTTIYSDEEVKKATLRINSISCPKLEKAKIIAEGSPVYQPILNGLTDSEEIRLINCNISTFIVTDDTTELQSSAENVTPIFAVGLKEFEDTMDQFTSASIVLSENKPDKPCLWARITKESNS